MSLSSSTGTSRIEIEQLARAQADRLLAPLERAAINALPPATARPPEPTLEERLVAIDRRWLECAQTDKAALATDLLDVSRKRFRAAVSCTKDEEVGRRGTR